MSVVSRASVVSMPFGNPICQANLGNPSCQNEQNSKEIPTDPWNIPPDPQPPVYAGNPFIFVFWGTWGMFQGSVGIFLEKSIPQTEKKVKIFQEAAVNETISSHLADSIGNLIVWG